MDDAQINELIQQCNDGKITLQELQQKLIEGGSQLKVWDKRTERNGNYPEGNNETRHGFLYNPYFHPRGKLFQRVKHEGIIQAINLAHNLFVHAYDRDAYVFDDPRLNELNEYFRIYVDKNMNRAGYKAEFFHKLIDIVLFLLKEDEYYWRIVDMLNKMPHVELNEAEKENLAKWH